MLKFFRQRVQPPEQEGGHEQMLPRSVVAVKPKSLEHLRELLEGGLKPDEIDMVEGGPARDRHFLPRKEMPAIVEAIEAGESLLIHGERRSGKTSILQKLLDDYKGGSCFLDINSYSISHDRGVPVPLDKDVSNALELAAVDGNSRRIIILVDEARLQEIKLLPSNFDERIAKACQGRGMSHITTEDITIVMASPNSLSEIRSAVGADYRWLPDKEIEIEPAIPVELREKKGLST